MKRSNKLSNNASRGKPLYRLRGAFRNPFAATAACHLSADALCGSTKTAVNLSKQQATPAVANDRRTDGHASAHWVRQQQQQQQKASWQSYDGWLTVSHCRGRCLQHATLHRPTMARPLIAANNSGHCGHYYELATTSNRINMDGRSRRSRVHNQCDYLMSLYTT